MGETVVLRGCDEVRGGEEEADLLDEEAELERKRSRRVRAVLSRLNGVERGVKEPSRTWVTDREGGSSERSVAAKEVKAAVVRDSGAWSGGCKDGTFVGVTTSRVVRGRSWFESLKIVLDEGEDIDSEMSNGRKACAKVIG